MGLIYNDPLAELINHYITQHSIYSVIRCVLFLSLYGNSNINFHSKRSILVILIILLYIYVSSIKKNPEQQPVVRLQF